MAKKIIKNNPALRKERHWGITVLSVLGYITAVFTLLGGIAMILGSTVVTSLIMKFAPDYTWLASVGVVALIFLGILFIAFAVLDYFIARGLWTGKNWARIVLLVLFILSALGAIASFQVVSLVIDALVIWYLGFYKEAVDYFK